MLRSRALVLLAVAAALLLIPGTAFASVAVAITEDGIEPDPVEADIDEPVVFTNESDGDVRLVDDDGRWDSGELAPGATFTITFSGVITSTFTSEDGSITGTIEIGGGRDDASAEEDPADDPTEDPTADPAQDEDTTEEPDDGATDDAASDDEDVPDGLADTGAPAASLAAFMGVALLGGAVLVRRTRRA